ncbi:MAG TPA: phosphate acyltransferase PlsX [Alphaproteobacteria bacterium]|nr:phosphate acyltransferase PlsX [Alphaproteobacteria bacterium]
MSGVLTIALDAMGGDKGPDAVIPGAALALSENPSLRFMIFGDEQKIRPLLDKFPAVEQASTIIHTDHFITADEKPAAALRNGRNSSMRLAINAVAEKQADCVVSGGNTGALMAMAKMVLKCLPGIERPAIASLLPTMGRETVMLDLGANLECDSEMLVQFAILGSVYSRAVRGHEQPTVGLLNIGSEDMKGHDEIKMAATILSQIKFPGKYVGFVEGNDIPMGKVDVVVTDGFTGNVALKTAEGVSKLIGDMLKKSLKKSPLAMLGAFLAKGALMSLKNEMDPRYYNGGMFLGLNGVCVKSHGGMDEVGFANAIKYAAQLAARNFNVRVAAEIAEVMTQEEQLNLKSAMLQEKAS